MIRVRDRDLFDIVVEEEKTLAKFLLDNGGEEHRTGSGPVCARLSLLQREREASGTRRVMARETFGIVVGKLETLAFFQKWYDLKDTHRPEGRLCVCGSLLQRQGRPRGRTPYVIRVRDRYLFDIVVGEEKTLAKFLLDNGGEGHRTERSERVRASLCCRGSGKPRVRVALWRERPLESWLGSSKLSPFFKNGTS